MRYRIGGINTGLGRNIGTDFNLDNKEEGLTKEQLDLADEIAKQYLKEFAYWYEDGMIEEGYSADFGFDTQNRFFVGWEPSYMYDPLNVVCFDLENKNESFRMWGTAKGAYGTDIDYSLKHYKDYKKKTNYIKFIDKYYDKLKEVFLG